ncbi:MAG: hypothetical protein EOM91_16675 [Sphingobacteriia bacterium]|nr:hypothetical protein [Sphingobacteriia bacterium]
MTTEKFAMVPWEFGRDRRLSSIDKSVLFALFSFRGSAGDWLVWPSRKAISERAGGYEPQTVSRSISRLASFGWLAVKRTRGASRYTLTVPAVPTYTPEVSGSDTSQEVSGSDTPEVSGSDTSEVSGSGTWKRLNEDINEDIPLPPKGEETRETNPTDSSFALTPEAPKPADAKKAKPKRGAMTAEIASRFEQFYSAYPRKVGRPAAAKAFAKIAPDDDALATMLAAIEAQHRAYRADPKHWRADGTLDKSFIAHPSTWLNQQRWDDEVEDVPDVEEPNAKAVLDAWSAAFPATPAQPAGAFRLTASARDLRVHWNAHKNHKTPAFWCALFEIARTDPALQEHRSRGRMTLAWALSERGFSQLLTALVTRQSNRRMEARDAA